MNSKSSLMTIFLMAFVVFGAYSNAFGQAGDDIAGEWVNVDPQTRGMTRIIVAQDDTGWIVQAFGKCHPTDCEWGWVAIDPLGETVADHSFKKGFAVWDHGFSVRHVTLIRRNDRLTVEIVNIFNDRSRRAGYRRIDVMKRVGDGIAKTVERLNVLQ
jgi:hypothetical protein